MRRLANQSTYGKIAICPSVARVNDPLLSALLTTGPVQECLKQSLQVAPPERSLAHRNSINTRRKNKQFPRVSHLSNFAHLKSLGGWPGYWFISHRDSQTDTIIGRGRRPDAILGFRVPRHRRFSREVFLIWDSHGDQRRQRPHPSNGERLARRNLRSEAGPRVPPFFQGLLLLAFLSLIFCAAFTWVAM
jgi:hypothetical protein